MFSNLSLPIVQAHVNEWVTPREARAQVREMCDYHGNLVNHEIMYTHSTRAKKTLDAVIKELESRDVEYIITQY